MEAVMTLIYRKSFFQKINLRKTVFGFLLIFILTLPVSRELLESSLILHMLVQLPLIVFSGWLVGKNTLFSTSFLYRWNEKGIPGLLIAVFSILFWMIPRWLDESLNEPFWEAMKFITIFLFVGVPLSISWYRLSSFAKGIVWANVISMLLVISWLYYAAPVRVCNNYLVNQQEEFAYASFILALIISFYWIVIAFFGNWKK